MSVEVRPASADQAAFLAELLARGLLIDCGVPGIYGHGAVFEDVRDRLETAHGRGCRRSAERSISRPCCRADSSRGSATSTRSPTSPEASSPRGQRA